MFDFSRWKDWSREHTEALSQRGFEAAFTITPASQASSDPAFFIDIDTGRRISRMIVWSTGNYDMIVQLIASSEPLPLPDISDKITDDTFVGTFRHFVQHATS